MSGRGGAHVPGARPSSSGWLIGPPRPGWAARFVGAGKAEDGGPLAVAGTLPDDFAVKEVGDLAGGEVAVEVEVAGVGGGGRPGEVEARGDPLGGEDERGVVCAGVGGGVLDLVEREVVDGTVRMGWRV